MSFDAVRTHACRCAFTIQEADYAFLFHQEPSFPHGHFAMLADQQRLQAYATALSTALNRAAATKRQQQQGLAGASSSAANPQQDTAPTSATAASGQQPPGDAEAPELTVVDLGCGSGVLSLLAAAALSQPAHAHCQGLPGQAVTSSTAPYGAAAQLPGATAAAPVPSAQTATTPSLQQPLRGSVVGIELTAPLAAVAQRAVAANGDAGVVSIVQADAASCRRGQQVPAGGADIIVLDMFDAGG